MKVELSIIIVNWNGMSFLPDCLNSIAQNPPIIDYEVVVIDNASTDSSLSWFETKEAKALSYNINCKLIKSKENLGFGKANNLVIEQTDSPYVFLLNPDTVVKPKAINKLLETLQSDITTGAVAPKLLNQDGTHQFSVWGFPPTPLSMLTEGLKLFKLLPSKFVKNWLYSYHWDYCRRSTVPIVSGAAIMAKREMINAVGAFDKDFHMYGEDFEWCVRINRGGWKTVFEPEAEIYHFGGLSALQRWSHISTRVKEVEGGIFFMKKCLPKYLVFLNLITNLLLLSLFTLKSILQRKNSDLLISVIKLHLTSIKSLIIGSQAL